MAEQERSHRCEVCGAGGTLVQFGDAREYHYHCLACWKQVAEQLAVDYALRAGAE